MGFLETRNLDFDNLIILSMNEGFMPPAPILKSYIPFSLRKAFKLPVHEHNDSINAYHFYRLMQRASQVELIYDTEISKTGSGEKSRFLLQLELEMSKRLPNIKFENKTSIILPQVEKTPLLDVQKTPDIITQLRKKFIDEKKSFSATAFTTYLDCPLRFYYRYVLGIREPQTAEDEMAPNVLEM
ncbi:MAG: PD-(D/E)XK nuclease family protein [Bacteroidetes bacterium]|nr:PD-(D/E)XK nuclease family protein [Bacteroidota bacterium]